MCFKKAILIIHGFAGGTYDEEFLANYLELDRSFDVYTFTLPGHDNMFKKKIKKEEWISCAENKIEMLINNGYKTIFVIGHSMGGVIACHLATKYSQIKKIVLAAPAFKYLSFNGVNFRILDAIKQSPSIVKTYSGNEIMARILKLPLPAIGEFLELVKMYQLTPQSITIPTLIIQGNSDQIVPVDSSKYVFDLLKTKTKRLILFDKVNHDLFRDNQKDKMSLIIKIFLKKRPNKKAVIEQM